MFTNVFTGLCECPQARMPSRLLSCPRFLLYWSLFCSQTFLLKILQIRSSCDSCHCVLALFCSTWWSLVPLIFLQVTWFHSSLWLNSTPLCAFSLFCLPVPLRMDTEDDSTGWLLRLYVIIHSWIFFNRAGLILHSAYWVSFSVCLFICFISPSETCVLYVLVPIVLSPASPSLTSGVNEISIVLSAQSARMGKKRERCLLAMVWAISPWERLNLNVFHPLTRSFIFKDGDIPGWEMT